MKHIRARSDDSAQEQPRLLERASTAELEQIKANVLTASTPRLPLAESLPALAVDLSRLDPHLVVLSEHDPFASRQYGKLVVTLISLAAARPLKRLLVTSAQHGDGRTSVVLNLAGALSSAKRRVLVLDTDLLRPSVLRLLGADVPAGLPEGVACGLPLEDVAVRVEPFGFSLLATRARVENPVGVLDSAMLRAYLQSLDLHYDFILFDSPPLLASPDAQVLLRLTDGVLLVIRPGAVTPAQMGRALTMFNKEDLIGVVLNRAETSSSYD